MMLSRLCAHVVPTLVLLSLLAPGCGASDANARDDDDAGATDDASPHSDASTPSGPGTLRNPVRAGAADPFLFFHEGYYYLTYTGVDRITLARATSVAGLAAAEPQTIWQDATPSRCCNMWAPELHRFGSKWYVYYTADDGQIQNHRMFVLESEGDDPFGPYTFKGQLATGAFFSIDGTVLTVGDAPYFVWSGVPNGSQYQNLYIAPMSDPWTLGGAPALLSQPYLPWEIVGVDGAIARVNEAPVALYHEGKTFVVFSASQCATASYALGTLTLGDGLDPLDSASWIKSDLPVFAQAPENRVYGPGHNSFFSSPDGTEIWNAYHAVEKPAGSCGGDRSLRVQKVEWNADGSPSFGVPVSETENLVLPSGDPGPAPLADGVYQLRARLNDLALTVAGCSDAEGADVVTGAYEGRPCDQWRIESVGAGAYRIANASSGQVLQVAGCATDDHADVLIGADTGAACQRWYLDDLGGGYHRVSAGDSGYPLDVDACSADPGAGVNVWHQWNPACQTWRLELVE